MQKIAEQAVSLASEKFGKPLDYTENSLVNLEALLQQAYEQNSTHGVSQETILRTARVWGGYLGEIMRRKWGGEWTVDGTEINLIINGKSYSPIRQVFQRITVGEEFDIKKYFADTLSEGMVLKIDDANNPSSPVLPMSSTLKTEGNKLVNYFVNFWKSGSTAKFLIVFILVFTVSCCFLALYLIIKPLPGNVQGTSISTSAVETVLETASTIPPTNTTTFIPTINPLLEPNTPESTNPGLASNTTVPTYTPTTTNTPAPSNTPTAGNPTATSTPASISCTTVILTKGPTLIYTGDNTRMRIFWQWNSNATFQMQWGTDTNYSLGNAAVTPNNTSSHLYTYDISSLTPGTKYDYRVVNGSQCSSGTFYAAPDSNASSIKFISYGDTRTNGNIHNGLAGQVVALYKSDPAFQTLNVNVGDWVSDDTDSAWMNEWFNPAYTNLRIQDANISDIGIRGNHEGDAIFWKQYWPEPFQSGGLYWSFDYGPAHFVMLDAYSDFGVGSAQYNWLEADLAATTKTWKFVAIHEPGWSAGGGHENNITFQTDLQPLIQQYGVAMVLAGHNHYYARAMVNDVVELTVGGGGAPLYTPQAGQPDVVVTNETYSFGEFTISGNTLSAKVVDNSGATIDTFTITK